MSQFIGSGAQGPAGPAGPQGPAGSGGALNQVEQVVCSGQAHIDLTTGLTGAYQNYFILLDGIDASAQQDLQMLVSTDGGATWQAGASYDWVLCPNTAFANGTVTPTGSGTIGDAKFVLGGGVLSALQMQGYFYGSQNGAQTKGYNLTGTYNSGGTSIFNSAFGRWKSNTVVNALRFLFAGGATFNAGIVTLYGVQE